MGYTEPAFEILADGTYVCVLRSSDNEGVGPMYLSVSNDHGVTWSRPKVFTRTGVLPQLLQLENGVVVLSSGRPGVQVRFSFDGSGATWTDPFEMLPYYGSTEEASCGYTNLLATGPDRGLMVYADFQYVSETKEIRKAIKVREIIVTPLSPN